VTATLHDELRGQSLGGQENSVIEFEQASSTSHSGLAVGSS